MLAASVIITTGAISYARTGSIQLSLENLPATTTLVMALLTLVGGVIGTTRTRTPVSFLVGHIVSPCFILAYAHLHGDRHSGEVLALFLSMGMAVAPSVTRWHPLPKELAYLGVYGVLVFGWAFIGIGCTLSLLFSMFLVVYREDLGRIQGRVDEMM